MARMIPECIDPDTKSSAEKKLFKLFKNMDASTDDWTIIHSVGLIKHVSQIQGEADYVVIVPNHGIFVLEVKGGLISFTNGTWTSQDGDGIIHPIHNPVTEATNARCSLRDFLKEHGFANLIMGDGIMMPGVSIKQSLVIPDVDEKQIYDADDRGNVSRYIKRLATFWKERCASNKYLVAPTKEQCSEIVSLIRKEYSAHVAFSTRIYNTEKQIIELTDNQKYAFDGLRENERCIVHGSAGTGKTVLAVQFVREQASLGKKVGLFCYNVQLAEYLKSALQDSPSVVCDSFTEYMIRESKLTPPTEDYDNFYNSELPQKFALSFIDEDQKPFDVIVLDEAQDLLSEDYLDALDTILKNGLDDGNWFFFMDADMQNIYRTSMKYRDVLDMLKRRKLIPAKYKLTKNCRNSPAIVQRMNNIFKMEAEYIPQDEDGINVDIKNYRRRIDQIEKLRELLAKLKSASIKNDDIVILSPYRYDNSSISEADIPDVTCNSNERKGKILFSTIHSFKGLESTVVILIDIDKMYGDEDKHILYIGMSRAKSALYMLVNKNITLG